MFHSSFPRLDNSLYKNCAHLLYFPSYCYTTDPEVQWEFCDILPCGSPDALQNETCEDCSNLQCGTNRIRQADYRGTINVTESGIPCQRWDAEEPHDLFFTPKDFPNDGLIENYCRNPSPEVDNRAWCYTTDPDKRWEFCKVPYCKDDFVPRRQCGTISKKQQDYRGEIAVTESGKTCVDWHESPNAAVDRYVSAEHPAAGLVDNYCRNPIGTHGRVRAWCYTDGLDIDWEYCPVDACHECGTPELNKTDYRGDEAKTASGKVCQHWLDTWPRNEVNGTNVFFDEWGLEGNFCRNPGGERKDAWCYVDSNTLEWELCNVTSCNDEDPGMTTITYDTCGTLGTKQADYRGLVNITESGIPCQSWDSQDPHRHKLTSEERPHNGLYGNFCRNPDNSERAWCYTENPDVLWEYCEVPLC